MWLPRPATDRACRTRPEWRDAPLAAVEAGPARRLAEVNRAAEAQGLGPGMPLTSALARLPGLRTVPHDPEGDRRMILALAERCLAFTPLCSVDGTSGLWLDVAGCDHLFGGETKLLTQLSDRLRRLGFTARAALASTPGAAWAWARFGDRRRPILDDAGELAPLPLAALRLDAASVAGLSALGVRRIGDLMELPRAQLTLRFGAEPARRLDQALGREPEPLSPLRPVVPHRVHAAFAEPIARAEDIALALERLLLALCRRLEAEGLGARHLDFTLLRVDGTTAHAEIGTHAPSRDPAHLARLFRDRLAEIAPGFGIDAARLEAPRVQPLTAAQTDLERRGTGEAELSRLLDSLGNRLGPQRLMRLRARSSHVPERQVARAAPAESPPAPDWSAERHPIRLLSHPEPIEAMAPIPDAPPLRFRRQGRLHRVVRADGPERIAPEWWHEGGEERDYYRVEDEAGLRFWLYRRGHYGAAEPPRWYLHGVFS